MIRYLILCIVCTVSTLTAGFEGAGASLPELFFNQIFSEYQKQEGTTINYSAIGSGRGMTLLKNNKVDFAATDISPSESLGPALLKIPAVVSGIAISYNLPEISSNIRLDGPVIAQIFAQKITRWNDSKLIKLNPKINLPNKPIKIIYRGSDSGTTYHLTSFLSRSTPKWKSNTGAVSKFVTIKGIRVESNSEMSDTIKQTSYSIGYLDWQTAIKHKLKIASIKNKENIFQLPSFNTINQASKFAEKANNTFITTFVRGKSSYPITSLTWLVINEKKDQKNDSIKKLIWWITHEGQLYAEENQFPPLSTTMMAEATNRLHSNQ